MDRCGPGFLIGTKPDCSPCCRPGRLLLQVLIDFAPKVSYPLVGPLDLHTRIAPMPKLSSAQEICSVDACSRSRIVWEQQVIRFLPFARHPPGIVCKHS